MSTPKVSDNTVFITGANRGMGLGYVKYYLQIGAKVVGTARNIDTCDDLIKFQKAYPDHLKIISLDVGSEASINSLKEKLGQLHTNFSMGINNAGISEENSFGSWTMKSFERHFRINTIGPALVSQVLIQFMNEGSKLIQISSGLGSMQWNLNPKNDFDAYSASKAGLHSLTVRLAEKLRKRNIIVTAINPGWVRTDMGGIDADSSIEEAVQNITKTIQNLVIAHTGKFLSEMGDEIPW